jgi:2,4-dienoyl-CoA reductase-like NADH-dependent reductase (Old Yellow Enzyme family)
MSVQLWHAGGWYNQEPWWHPAPLSSPSGLDGKVVVGDPLSDEEIADIIESYRSAAVAARQIGFDAIDIHGAHGFLIDQFFWSVTNRRKDRWGGIHLSDRLEFALAVYRAVRDGGGPEMPISLRISQWKEQDYSARLAETPEELRRWVEPFASAGINLFNCSQRRFWEPEFADTDLNLAGWVKKLTGVPTMTVGSVGLDVDVIESFDGKPAAPAPLTELLRRFERGDFDLIGVGRALLSDPQWVKKVELGRFDELSAFDAKTIGVVY